MAAAAAAGSAAAVIGRPMTSQSAPAAIASRGVRVRAWSPASDPAGRMPGTTSSGSGPISARSRATSCGLQTSPSAPAPSRRGGPGAEPGPQDCPQPRSRPGPPPKGWSEPSPPAAWGALLPAASAAFARRVDHCRAATGMERQHGGPKRQHGRTPPATVFGMSCSLRSRKTGLVRHRPHARLAMGEIEGEAELEQPDLRRRVARPSAGPSRGRWCRSRR